MADSIRKCLDEADTVSELKLLLSASKDKTFVVLEGDDDIRLFKSLLGCKVGLVQSYQSKIGVEKMIQVHFPREKHVIGIRDKDYQQKPLSNRIFYCDFCCLEMMVIANDEVLERVYNSYCNTVIGATVLRLTCLRHLELLSELRCLNEREKWNVKFDGINPQVLYDEDQSAMDENVIRYLNSCNPDNTISDERYSAVKKQFPIKNSENELLYIANGHDFTSIFHYLGKIKESKIVIGKALRSSFGKNEFKKTQLYRKLLEYQQKNKIAILDY